MTDNFNKYREFIELCGNLPDTNRGIPLDKYYVIELMRRGKDNPDMPAANYHFKNYYIYSWHDLNKYEQEIKDVCTLLKMRAYCSVNYKLMSQVALDTLAEGARRIALHDYKKFYSVFESASGKFAERNNGLWVVDVDNTKEKEEDSKVKMIIDLINKMDSGYNPVVVYTMPTKSGVHLITHPFNLKQFNDAWNDNLYGIITMPDVKKNHITLLYENL